jgi:DNA adenine methylase
MQKMKKHIAKPFLKWAGGKGQLLEQFSDFFPEELKSGKIRNYYEPFVGGGAVFLNIIQHFEIENSTLYDINNDLVLTWKVVQKNVNELIDSLHTIQKEYLLLSEEDRKTFYYNTRKDFNYKKQKINYFAYDKEWIAHASNVIFLNKTCFNGLFRFNLKGEFNVPMGSYKNPKILDAENLKLVSRLLEKSTIKLADYKEVEKDLVPDSFVYFDPPYRPLNQTSSFTAYNSTSFNDSDQKELAKLFQKIHSSGAKQMLSNSDPKNVNPDDTFFDDLYQNFNIFRVSAKRAINSNANKRNTINEILVTNYRTNAYFC